MAQPREKPLVEVEPTHLPRRGTAHRNDHGPCTADRRTRPPRHSRPGSWSGPTPGSATVAALDPDRDLSSDLAYRLLINDPVTLYWRPTLLGQATFPTATGTTWTPSATACARSSTASTAGPPTARGGDRVPRLRPMWPAPVRGRRRWFSTSSRGCR